MADPLRLTRAQHAALLASAREQEAAYAAQELGEEPQTCPPVFDPIGLRRMLRHAVIVEEGETP